MSISTIDAVWKRSKSRLADRLVLLALADHANDSGECWPGVESLAAKAKLSERQCRRCLRSLEHLGEIETEAQDGPHGTNRFRITLITRGGQFVPPDKSGTEGGTNRTQTRSDLSPEPSFEPSIEPTSTTHSQSTLGTHIGKLTSVLSEYFKAENFKPAPKLMNLSSTDADALTRFYSAKDKDDWHLKRRRGSLMTFLEYLDVEVSRAHRWTESNPDHSSARRIDPGPHDWKEWRDAKYPNADKALSWEMLSLKIRREYHADRAT